MRDSAAPQTMEQLDRAAKQRLVDEIQWHHSIRVGEGVVTPGGKTLEHHHDDIKRLQLPSLAGRSVLDIGAWDGFFSFEAERRGASRVLAVDSYCWSGEGWGKKAGFELARRS